MPLRRDQVAPQVQRGVLCGVRQDIDGHWSEVATQTIKCKGRSVLEAGPPVVPASVQALVPIQDYVDLCAC